MHYCSLDHFFFPEQPRPALPLPYILCHCFKHTLPDQHYPWEKPPGCVRTPSLLPGKRHPHHKTLLFFSCPDWQTHLLHHPKVRLLRASPCLSQSLPMPDISRTQQDADPFFGRATVPALTGNILEFQRSSSTLSPTGRLLTWKRAIINPFKHFNFHYFLWIIIGLAWQLFSLFHCPSLFPIVFCLKFYIIKGKIIFACFCAVVQLLWLEWWDTRAIQPTAVGASVSILNMRHINTKPLYSSFFTSINLHLCVFKKSNLVGLEECSFTAAVKRLNSFHEVTQ